MFQWCLITLSWDRQPTTLQPHVPLRSERLLTSFQLQFWHILLLCLCFSLAFPSSLLPLNQRCSIRGPCRCWVCLSAWKNSWRTLVSLRGLHRTPRIILEISAFLSCMVMHTVHLRLEYGPEEQNGLLSLQLTMHSLFLWPPHFQEIQFHCLAATISREITKDCSALSIAISTFGVQAFTGWHWPVACVPKVAAEHFRTSWGETPSLPTNSLKSLREDEHTTKGRSWKP